MTRTLGIRVSAEVAARVEAYRDRLNRQNPAGIEISTSDTARELLLRGLDAVEGEGKRTRK